MNLTAMIGHGLTTRRKVECVALIGVGLILLLIAVASYSYTHEGAVVIFFLGVLSMGAGILPLAHNLPSDSSPF
jgi:hypothetical protein